MILDFQLSFSGGGEGNGSGGRIFFDKVQSPSHIPRVSVTPICSYEFEKVFGQMSTKCQPCIIISCRPTVAWSATYWMLMVDIDQMGSLDADDGGGR